MDFISFINYNLLTIFLTILNKIYFNIDLHLLKLIDF
jgi:hypothetical protein